MLPNKTAFLGHTAQQYHVQGAGLIHGNSCVLLLNGHTTSKPFLAVDEADFTKDAAWILAFTFMIYSHMHRAEMRIQMPGTDVLAHGPQELQPTHQALTRYGLDHAAPADMSLASAGL